MKVIDDYKKEYQSLRTCLFNLELKLRLQSKISSNDELEATKSEIEDIKKKMCHLIYLSDITKSDINGGNIK